jgi:hypothetical protein
MKVALVFLIVSAAGIALAQTTRPATQPKGNWRDGPKVSPFEAVRFGDLGVPEVRVRGTWYELMALDNLSADQLMFACQAVEPKDWQKRFAEDLIGILVHTKGRDPNANTVTLTVKDLQTGQVEALDRVPMTATNRSTVYQTRIAEEQKQRDAATSKPAQ